jgi:hypothetical protein
MPFVLVFAMAMPTKATTAAKSRFLANRTEIVCAHVAEETNITKLICPV